jgi:hypothetical protein
MTMQEAQMAMDDAERAMDEISANVPHLTYSEAQLMIKEVKMAWHEAKMAMTAHLSMVRADLKVREPKLQTGMRGIEITILEAKVGMRETFGVIKKGDGAKMDKVGNGV